MLQTLNPLLGNRLTQQKPVGYDLAKSDSTADKNEAMYR